MTLLFSDIDARTEAVYLALLRERGMAARLAAMQGLNAGLRALLISDPVPTGSPKSLDQPGIRYRIADWLVRAEVLPREVLTRRIQGVLKLQGASMDHGYLRQWARTLNVADLLARSMRDAGIGE